MNSLAGTPLLLRLGLRRDRLMLPIWLYALTAGIVGTAVSIAKLYGTTAARQEFSAGINKNGAVLAMYGRIFNTESVGGITAWRMGTIGGVLVALMSVLLVTRHTRAEEEAGRLELVGAGAVGRRAPLGAALLVALVANATLAFLVAVGLMVVGQPIAGSIAFGLAWASVGLVFAAIAAISAQLTESARTANGIAIAAIATAYLLRAAADAGHKSWLAALSWVSPIGWAQHVRAFAGERWAVFALPVAFIAVAISAAYVLVSRRDLNAGLLPPRLGPARAKRWLRTPLALGWRIHRGWLVTWLVGFAAYGAAIGGIANGTTDLVKDSAGTRKLFAKLGGQQGITDSFIATCLGMLGLIAAVYAVQVVLRLRSEETALRAEPLLATAVKRVQWAAGHLAFALLGTALILVAAGFTSGLAYGLATSDVGTQLPRLTGAALAQLPAAWLVAGVAVALVGLVPRFTQVSWIVIGLSLALGPLGPAFNLPQWALDLSPFTHLPKLPGNAAITATPFVWLVVIAAAFAAAGLVGLRRRDIG